MSATYRTRIITEYRTPDEALRLNEDIMTLGIVIKLLGTVEYRSICDETETGRQILGLTISQLRMCQKVAQRKLRYYLLPQKKDFERQTRAGVQVGEHYEHV